MLTSSSRTRTKNLTQAVEEASATADEPHAAALAVQVSILRDGAIVLTPGRWSIGSDPQNQIVVPDDTVEARHAMIIVTEHRVVMTSWSDATYVNSHRCSESLLCPGDILTVGTIDIAVRSASGPELIAQLPEVSSDETTPAPLPPVTENDLQRRLQDLDTALGLLTDEYTGESESEDTLDELVDSIQRDLEHRVPQILAEQEQSDEKSASTDEISSIDEPASEESNTLDDVLNEVETETDDAMDQADPFEPSHEDETETEDADEFAILVGSTSILAQNMTLNALRSRADAIRQLDELVIAATGSEDSVEGATASSIVPALPSPTPTSNAGQLPAAPEDDDNVPSNSSDSTISSTEESEPVDQAEQVTDSVAAEEVDTESGLATDAASEPESAAEDRVSSVDTWESTSAPAWDSDRNDEYSVQPVEDRDAAGEGVCEEASSDWDESFTASQPATLPDNDSSDESSCDDAGQDTVELSSTETVQNAGSLFSSLFQDEPPSEPESAGPETEAMSEPALDVASSESELESSFFDAPIARSLAAETGTAPDTSGFDSPDSDTSESGTASDVRSRLAEMFDMPELTSEPENSEPAEPVASPAPQPFSSFSEPQQPAAPTNVASWLDSIKQDTDPQSGSTTEAASEAGHVTEAPQQSTVDPTGSFASTSASTAPTSDVSNNSDSGSPTDSGFSEPDEAADPIASYMKDLIARNRARHGMPENAADYVVQPVDHQPSEPETTEATHDADQTASLGPVESQDNEPTTNWLTQQPKHQVDKEQLRAEVQTLREVANQTARSAVSKATRKQLKVQVAVKAAASVIMLGSGAAATVLGVSKVFAFGVMAIGVYFAADLAITIARNWQAVKP